MSTGSYKELLIAGYIREHNNALDLFMIIPNGIGGIMHDFYPVLVFRFGDHKAGAFEIDDEQLSIKGANPQFMEWACNGQVIYAELGSEYSNGLKQGIHYWSVKNVNPNQPRCFASIGVATEKNGEIIDTEHLDHWIGTGCNSFHQGMTNWPSNHVKTVILNCNEWNVTYYRNEKIIQKDAIEPNQNYYFTMICCGRVQCTNLRVVSDPVIIDSNE